MPKMTRFPIIQEIRVGFVQEVPLRKKFRLLIPMPKKRHATFCRLQRNRSQIAGTWGGKRVEEGGDSTLCGGRGLSVRQALITLLEFQSDGENVGGLIGGPMAVSGGYDRPIG
jgi:hypothetical protein